MDEYMEIIYNVRIIYMCFKVKKKLKFHLNFIEEKQTEVKMRKICNVKKNDSSLKYSTSLNMPLRLKMERGSGEE